MINPKIREEAVDYHTLARLIKDKDPEYGEINNNDMLVLIKEVEEELSRLNLNNKESILREDGKDIYFAQNILWFKKTLSIDKISNVLPDCGDIPQKVLLGDLVSVIDFIKDNHKMENELESTTKVYSMLNFPSLLKIPLTVIQPGYYQRGRIVNSALSTVFYIEDGNHRAIAMGIRGDTQIQCIVGALICQNCFTLIESNNDRCQNCEKQWDVAHI